MEDQIPQLAQLGPEKIRKFFVWALVGVPAIAIVVRWILQNRSIGESGFKLREADRKKLHQSEKIEAAILIHQKAKAEAHRQAPLQLTGISIQGPPHEILNVKIDASEKEIQKAYRDLMKRYHPDVMGRIGSREWTDAQKIAEAINQAKVEMFSKLQEKNPNRSGR